MLGSATERGTPSAKISPSSPLQRPTSPPPSERRLGHLRVGRERRTPDGAGTRLRLYGDGGRGRGGPLALCGAVFVRSPEPIVALPSGKLINNSAWQKASSPPTAHSLAPCCQPQLLPRGVGLTDGGREQGARGAHVYFWFPFKVLEGTSGGGILWPAFYLLCTPRRGEDVPFAGLATCARARTGTPVSAGVVASSVTS